MRTKWFAFFVISLLLAVAGGCTLPQRGTPTPIQTLISEASATNPLPSATLEIFTATSPTTIAISPATVLPTVAITPPTQPALGIIPGSPSGPYAVVLVEPDDVLNIRSAAGVNSAVVGTFAPTFTNVQRSGPSAIVGGASWVEVNNPSGGRGWVNAAYLTEYVPQTSMCDQKTMNLLANLERAVQTADGALLASLASPTHGVDVWAYRSGQPINFDTTHIRWVFNSTYVHNWGMHPASGLDVTGSFQQVILPMLVDIYDNGCEIHCNERGVPGWNISAWPEAYTNYHVYKIYKPGTPGVDLDYRVWLAGVEYLAGQPYLTALINFIWTP